MPDNAHIARSQAVKAVGSKRFCALRLTIGH